MATVRTRYTLLQRPGSLQGTYQSFELDRNTETGALTLVALDIFAQDRTHYDLGNAGISYKGSSVYVGGLANGVEFVAPRATYDFVLNFDLNDPTHAILDRGAITLDVGSVTASTPLIDQTYYDLLGRLPNGSELDHWNSRFDNGSVDVSALRHTIVDDPSAGASVRAKISALYLDLGGRDASADELAFWGTRLADGEHYSGVRTAIIDDPLGRNHIAAVTSSLYQEFAGRPASTQEIAFWTGEIRQGTDYDGIRRGILDDPLGKGHTAAQLDTLYHEYFDRDPISGETAVWDGFLHQGLGFADVAATLALDHGSDGTVRRFTGMNGTDIFDFGPNVGHTVIYNFEPRLDLIKLTGTAFAGIDPLDGAHARDVFQPDGAGHGVLITLSDHDTILIHDTFLSLLQDVSHPFV